MAERLQEVDPTVQRSFDFYTQTLAYLNTAHPQHQGFMLDEFTEAIQDPGVIKTEVTVAGGDSVQLPQLAPPEAFGWLHAEYYAEKFPDEYAAGNVMHFADLPGVVPAEAVDIRIQELAQDKGVLVFDFPDIDGNQPVRILDYLESLGVRPVTYDTTEPEPDSDPKRAFKPELWRRWQAELERMEIAQGSIELLGTQTYHVGVVTLKRRHQARDPHLSYAEAFDEMVQAGEIPEEQFFNGVSVHDVIEGAEADRLQAFYDDAYGTISDHPCEQGLTPDEFAKKLQDTSTSKTVFRRDGVAESLCLTTEDLEHLTWVNEDYYYKPDFVRRFGDGPVTWYPGVATDPDPAIAGNNFGEIMGWFTKLSERGDNNSVVVFDTPDVNTEFLPASVDFFVNASPEAGVTFTRIGDQKYCAMRLESISDSSN